jgi:soluble lytic murein transglycosylase-like protein
MAVDYLGSVTGSREIAQVILHNAALFDIPPALAFALCWEESRYTPRAVNRKNRNASIDRGLFQLNDRSFPDIAAEDFFNPRINAYYGLGHLRWCLNTGGTEVSALAMYNAGTNRVHNFGTPKNTLDYIHRILQYRRKLESAFSIAVFRTPREEEPEAEIQGVETVAVKQSPLFRLSPLSGPVR